MIPKTILDQPALKHYSVRATVVTSEKVASGYLVQVAGNRMRSLGLNLSPKIPLPPTNQIVHDIATVPSAPT